MSERRTSALRAVALVLLAIFFAAAGINHFAHPALSARIVPPWLPARALLVQISGVFEILGGIGMLLPKTRRFSGVGLIALLVAVFPANLQMALHPSCMQTSRARRSSTFGCRFSWFSSLGFTGPASDTVDEKRAFAGLLGEATLIHLFHTLSWEGRCRWQRLGGCATVAPIPPVSSDTKGATS